MVTYQQISAIITQSGNHLQCDKLIAMHDNILAVLKINISMRKLKRNN